MPPSTTISRDLAPDDLEVIAAMHLHASIAASGNRHPGGKFRFSRDKIRLFQEFDPHSTLMEKDEPGRIRGVLVYTHDEASFHRFAGPPHGRFWMRALKTLCGYYGFDFPKYLAAARSMLGKGDQPDVPAADHYGKIWVLLVAEECRRQGVAERLVTECIRAMRERGATRLRVTVHVDNHAAIHVYEKCGFRTVGTCVESSGPSLVMQMEI
jgi:ribosomal protein S18 acetylase RimI-like enzyme